MAPVDDFEVTLADHIATLTRVSSPSPNPYPTPLSSVQRNRFSMPAIYTPHSRLPPTPPEFFPQYSNGMRVDMNQQCAYNGPVEKYWMGDRFAHHAQAAYVPPPVINRQHWAREQAQAQAGYPLPPPGIAHPNPAAKRTSLPPAYDNTAYAPRQERAPVPEPVPEPEKPSGGVSATLDYEMDLMTDFVGMKAMELIMNVTYDNGQRLQPSYRKFVNQILSSTRLPKATILLGLAYLKKRMLMLDISGHRLDHVYRYLTIALLLASKFLDDNTFQNKSWSEVTALTVTEINKLEKHWLEDISWNLHIDRDGKNEFREFSDKWNLFRDVRLAPATPPLAPVDTGRTRSYSTYVSAPVHPTQYFRPVTNEHTVQLPPVRHEDAQYWSRAEYSPPSAPHTGPTTPESYHNSYGWPTVAYDNNVSSYRQAAPTDYSRLPPIQTAYNHNTWFRQHDHAHAPINCFCGQNSNNFYTANYGPPIIA